LRKSRGKVRRWEENIGKSWKLRQPMRIAKPHRKRGKKRANIGAFKKEEKEKG